MYDRSKSIGASDAVHIHKGQWAELFDRKQLSNAPDYGLAARVGHATESLHRDWFTQETGIQIEHRPEWDDDPFYRGNFADQDHDTLWYKFLPDGLIDNGAGDNIIPWEAKALNCFWKPEYVLAKYMPQLQHAMYVMDAPYAILSVIYLAIKWEFYTIAFDPVLHAALLEKEKLFYWFLEQGQRPPEKKGRNWI